MSRRVSIAIASVMASGACGEVVDEPDPRQTVLEVPATPNRDLDLLFVVDDSPSMLDKQTNLVNNFAALADRLESAPGGLPNLHLGVVSTDLGTKASGSETPGPSIGQVGQGGCAGTGKNGVLQTNNAPVTGSYLIDVNGEGGGRTRNYTGGLSEVFSTMARAGATGCGFEQPLAAMRRALDGNPANAGFLRQGAILGVVFLADEDDCSAKSTTLFSTDTMALGALQSFRCTRFGVTCTTGGQTEGEMNQVGPKGGCGPSTSSDLVDDVAPYREFLQGLERDGRRVFVSGIVGPAEPVGVELRAPPGGGPSIQAVSHSCTYAGATGGQEVADPAVRLKSLIDGFPGRSSLTTICQQDLSGGLLQIAELFRSSSEIACVERALADAEPGTPGLQIDCTVEDLIAASVIEIKSCDADASARPCWQLQPDAVACGFAPAPNLKLVVQRTAPPDPATITRVRCLAAP